MEEYSESIVRAVKEALAAEEIKHSFDEEMGVFKFGFNLPGKISTVNMRFAIHESDCVLYTFMGISFDKDDESVVKNMNDFINRANYGLRCGCFEIDVRDGEIRYKVFMDCSGLEGPTKEMVSRAIYISVSMIKRYSKGLLGVIFSDMSSDYAIRLCEDEQ